MAGFTDLLVQAQPSLVDRCLASATEGRSWRWEITGFVDSLGADIDLTPVVGTCKILDKVNGTTILTPTVTCSPGKVTITAAPADTAGLVPATKTTLRYVWTLVLFSGASQVQVWGPTHSEFKIEAE